jgi:phosphoribosylformimino-5-aminoimidazole carboxamide ribotide isomerase
MNVIPAIDLLGGRCVRLYQGDYNQAQTFNDDPVAVAQAWVAQGATRLHLVDLDGAKTGQPTTIK